MPQTITDATIRTTAPPPTGTITIWDASLRNFGLRVSSGGAKSFIVLVASGSRKAIGRYPIISLAEARSEARRILAEKTLTKTRPGRTPFHEALTNYLTGLAPRNRSTTHKETSRLLNKHFLPKLRHKPLADIVAADITKIIDALADVPGEANHAFSAIKTFLRWTSGRGLIPYSPIADMRPPSRPVSRDRVLSGEELKAVWIGAGERLFGPFVRLLITLGSRRGEIAALRWSWIDEENKVISFPREAMKAARPHVIPYGNIATAILAGIPRTGELLFPARGADTPMSGFSKAKAAVDTRVKIEPWSLHDLRRTFATNLAALGVRIEVTEMLLGHTSGKLGGIVSIYQRFDWLEPMREAVAFWENRLARILA